MHPYLDVEPPIAFAHRGAHDAGAGENSFEAFERAVALGFRHIETDVHRSADGVLVAMHDATLDRTTDGQGEVAQRAWGEIARLHVAGGGRVARLDELLDEWPDVRWNIDCKDPAAVRDLLCLVRQRGVAHRVCLGSFDRTTVKRLRAGGEDLCTAASSGEVRRLVLAARLPTAMRRAATLGVGCDAVQVPVEHDGTTVVTAAFVEVCHERGIPVHVWTVDDEREMERLLDIGVDGLMTDRPGVLRDVLRRRGAWVDGPDRAGAHGPLLDEAGRG